MTRDSQTRDPQPPRLARPDSAAAAAGVRPLAGGEDGAPAAFAHFRGMEGFCLLAVCGEAMIDEHILDGDSLLVEKTGQARGGKLEEDKIADGELVVAAIDGGEPALARFYREDGRVRLQPANKAMQPATAAPERVRILGRVMAVHRRFRWQPAGQEQ